MSSNFKNIQKKDLELLVESKKPGPKKKDISELKKHIIQIRITEEEKKILEKKIGLTPKALYIRDILEKNGVFKE